MAYIHFSKKQLSNGLVVIHHEDTTTPFVVVNLLYKVGAIDENPERTGFAHLFEHLMFEGTKQVPYFDGPLQEAGGENNAFTNNDYTNYYDIVPAENKEVPFWLEADRMQNLAINQTSLKVQKKVVIEEFKENYINQPYGDAYHLLRQMVYQKHPYQWPTIGKEISHIQNAGLGEVKAFFEQFYVPNNAILVVSGNITTVEAFQLSEKWMGTIAPNPALHKAVFDEPEQIMPRQSTVFAAVPQDCIYLAFQMPGRMADAYYHADVLTDILSTGTSARLHQRLLKEKGLFSEIDAYISGSNDIGMFIVEGRISAGISPEEALSAVWKELIQLQEEPVSAEELSKVKNKMMTYMNFSDASLLNRSISLAYYEMLGDAALINEEEARFEAVTAADVQQFAQLYLRPEKSNTLFYLSKLTR
jgi:zinc protease